MEQMNTDIGNYVSRNARGDGQAYKAAQRRYIDWCRSRARMCASEHPTKDPKCYGYPYARKRLCEEYAFTHLREMAGLRASRGRNNDGKLPWSSAVREVKAIVALHKVEMVCSRHRASRTLRTAVPACRTLCTLGSSSVPHLALCVPCPSRTLHARVPHPSGASACEYEHAVLLS